jgi:hypothetical protein
LIYTGFVDQGVEIVRVARSRHDGFRRSPWNEAEAGYHYARSMSSWALLLAYSGFEYSAPRRAIRFAPSACADHFRCFFSTGSGWGIFSQTAHRADIAIRYGSLALSEIHLQIAGAHATINGDSYPVRVASSRLGTRLSFEPIFLTAGDVLRIEA